MAFIGLSSFFLIFLFLLPTLSVSSSKYHSKTLFKTLHFTLYQHDKLNTTGFPILKGIIPPMPNSNQYGATPGSMYVLNDPQTMTLDPSSEPMGSMEGLMVTSSVDGFDNLMMGKVTLNLKDHKIKGSISMLGSFNTKVYYADIPVVGGTGDFLLVQGHVAVSLVSWHGVDFTYKFDFHLYWPPYAAQALKA